MKILPTIPGEFQPRPMGGLQPPTRDFEDMLGAGAAGEATMFGQPDAVLQDDGPEKGGADASLAVVVAALIQPAAPQQPVVDGPPVQTDPVDTPAPATPAPIPTVSVAEPPRRADVSTLVEAAPVVATLTFDAPTAPLNAEPDKLPAPLNVLPNQGSESSLPATVQPPETPDLYLAAPDRAPSAPIELPAEQVQLTEHLTKELTEQVAAQALTPKPSDAVRPVDTPPPPVITEAAATPPQHVAEPPSARVAEPSPKHVEFQAQTRAFAFQELGWFDRVAVAEASATARPDQIAFTLAGFSSVASSDEALPLRPALPETVMQGGLPAAWTTVAAQQTASEPGAPPMRAAHGRPLAAVLGPQRASLNGAGAGEPAEDIEAALGADQPDPRDRPAPSSATGPNVTVLGEAGGPLEVMAVLQEFDGGEGSRLRDAAAEILAEFNADLGGFSLNGAKVSAGRVR